MAMEFYSPFKGIKREEGHSSSEGYVKVKDVKASALREKVVQAVKKGESPRPADNRVSKFVESSTKPGSRKGLVSAAKPFQGTGGLDVYKMLGMKR